MMGWQWHQLDHMQIICTLQTDNHASSSLLPDKLRKKFKGTLGRHMSPFQTFQEIMKVTA